MRDIPFFYEFCEYRFDPHNEVLLRQGEALALTQKSGRLLKYLIENRGRAIGKEELFAKVWPDTYVEPSTLTSHIYMLRKTLCQNGKGDPIIQTVPRKGYCFSAEVKEIESESAMPEAPANPLPYAPSPEAPLSKGVISWQSAAGRQSLLLLAIAAILAGLAIAGFKAYESTGLRNGYSIAVLPFQQINIEKDSKMGLGMADVLITRLGGEKRIKVAPTSAIARFADQESLDPYLIGEELNVDFVLTASSQCDNGTARVTFQLHDIWKNRIILSEMINESHDGVFPMQDRISNRIYDRISGEIIKE